MKTYTKLISIAVLCAVLFIPFIQKAIKWFFGIFGKTGTVLYWVVFVAGCAYLLLLVFDLATFFLRKMKDNYRNIKK